MGNDNNLGRVLVLLLLATLMSFGLYLLPDNILGLEIKRVDLLSDFKFKESDNSLDSLKCVLEMGDTIEVDSVALRDSIMRSSGIDSVSLALRDSLYNAVYAVEGADSLGTHIEDYSIGHIGLKRFFAALKNSREMNRPVRVAFLGDSFIEGDIVVADFRSALQSEFGGRGVGFVPVASVAAQFRPTLEQESEGWRTWSMLTDHEHSYTLSGMLFEPEDEMSTINVKTTSRYQCLEAFSSLKLIYERNNSAEMQLSTNGSLESSTIALPATTGITQYELEGEFTEANITFSGDSLLRMLGVVMEDNNGVVVDNFSLRGNSGMILDRLDSTRCQELCEIRPYDLIVLQYGLNIVTDSVMSYGWYGNRMVNAISHLKRCFPNSDILMLGVSDRSRQVDGEFETMPAVLALIHAQRSAAKKAGVTFWNTFGAMGGENSMVGFVERNWASKDYTHMSFRGGREIANALLNALMLEKKFYDEAEKVVR